MDLSNKIHTIRGIQVMLDSDLAELYEVSTKRLNEQVKRNQRRFPKDFCFQLTEVETDSVILKSQFATSSFTYGGRRYLPYAFTEHGVAALAGVLKSKKAVEVNIKIIRAFISMRKFIAQNADIFHKLNTHDRKILEHDQQFEKILNTIEQKQITPDKGIFYDGQVFDAYIFITKIIKSAKESIILIDNYVDETTLMLLAIKQPDVNIAIFTKDISQTLNLAKDKFNKQYGNLEINHFDKSHDRFLIIDETETFHIGASLKDAGKKWFAFSKLDKESISILKKTTE